MKLPNNQIKLCCGGKGCPVISKKGNGMVQIKDDFGGSILLKEEEARLIEEALNKFKAK